MQFFVLGMHRSGTSALARVLGLMGCHMGAADELAAPDAHNPKGYWERRDVWDLDERLLAALGGSWHDVGALDLERLAAPVRDAFDAQGRALLQRLDAARPWVAKDPRVSVLLSFWRPLLEQPVVVLVHRNPLEVARSLQARDGFPLAAGLGLWEAYTRAALRDSRGLPRVLVDFARLRAEPVACTRRLLEDLHAVGVPAGLLRVPEARALDEFLDPQLRHQQAEHDETWAWLNEAQRALWSSLESGAALQADVVEPLSAAGRDALDSLARQTRRERDGVQLLEGLLAEKDRNALALEARHHEQAARHGADVQMLEAMLAEKDRYTISLTREVERLRGGHARASILRQTLARARQARPSGGAGEPVVAGDWSAFAICTIVSRNYLSLARLCCHTFLAQHPGARAFVLLVDALDGLDLAQEPFECLAASALGIPEFDDFAFKYGIVELNTAVKPYVLEYLFEQRDVANVFYVDPDIQVFSPLHEARALLERGQVVLTPHILAPYPQDGRRPNEVDLLLSGAYNLGFLGLRRTPETRALLQWQQQRLYDGCFSDTARGLFTDQKWMDLVPCLYPGVSVLRHPGYNVAYWNLHERRDVRRGADGVRVNGWPLRFFHFSGFDRRRPQRVSKHQDRFRMADLPAGVRALFADYAGALDAFGWETTQGLPYAYGRFDNGARIPDFARRLYHRQGAGRLRFGNPFHTAGPDSFYAWLTRPAQPDGLLSPLLLEMRAVRADLVQAFPDPEGASLSAYLAWIVQNGCADFGLDASYQRLFEEARACAQARLEQAPPAAPGPVPPAGADLPARGWKQSLRRLLGARAYHAVRRRVWDAYAWLGAHLGIGPAAAPPQSAVPGAPVAVTIVSPPPRRPFGVNLFGYLDTESGVGEVARGLALMLEAAGVPHARINIEQQWLRRGDTKLRGFSREQPYAIDLLAVNADQTAAVMAQHGLRRGDGRARIGYWFWELATFPHAAFAPALALVDELWVASDFCRDALAAGTDVPVVKIVPALGVAPARRHSRADFGLHDEFVFLFVFDAASVVKRKNPGGVVAAFRRAFTADEPVRLILKTVNASARQRAAFERLAGPARVQVWDGYWPHGQVLDLVSACDAYVSLHRSEGLGLTLLDALMLDKPVVATRYSGVTEFFDGPGTYPVEHALVPLRRAYGPYPVGALWAQPDLAHAAQRLREVYETWSDPARRPAAGHGAAQRARYSVESTRAALVARLESLRRQHALE
jgi:glycosyltransferase involved in cell wall biosynthesis